MIRPLYEARKAAGLTQEQVADCANIDRTAYSRIENGLRKPDVSTALLIAGALNKSVEEIFLASDVLNKHECIANQPA